MLCLLNEEMHMVLGARGAVGTGTACGHHGESFKVYLCSFLELESYGVIMKDKILFSPLKKKKEKTKMQGLFLKEMLTAKRDQQVISRVHWNWERSQGGRGEIPRYVVNISVC